MPNNGTQTGEPSEKYRKSIKYIQPHLPKGNKWIRDRHGNLNDKQGFLEANARCKMEKTLFPYHASEKICANVSARCDKDKKVKISASQKRPLNKESQKKPRKSKKKIDHGLTKSTACKIEKKTVPTSDYIKGKAAQMRRAYENGDF